MIGSAEDGKLPGIWYGCAFEGCPGIWFAAEKELLPGCWFTLAGM